MFDSFFGVLLSMFSRKTHNIQKKAARIICLSVGIFLLSILIVICRCFSYRKTTKKPLIFLLSPT